MSKKPDLEDADIDRRAVIQAAGVALLGGFSASSVAAPYVARSDSSIGGRLRGVQHFGVTVQDMERAFAFYTEVLGGTEVMRDGDFHGERIHNTLLTDQEIEARARQVNPRSLGVPDLRSGPRGPHGGVRPRRGRDRLRRIDTARPAARRDLPGHRGSDVGRRRRSLQLSLPRRERGPR